MLKKTVLCAALALGLRAGPCSNGRRGFYARMSRKTLFPAPAKWSGPRVRVAIASRGRAVTI